MIMIMMTMMVVMIVITIIGQAKRDSLTSLNWDFGIYVCVEKFKEVNACLPPEATLKRKH